MTCCAVLCCAVLCRAMSCRAAKCHVAICISPHVLELAQHSNQYVRPHMHEFTGYTVHSGTKATAERCRVCWCLSQDCQFSKVGSIVFYSNQP